MAERTGYEPGTPSWVDLTTPDLQAALRFYGELFGWEFEDAGEVAGHYHQALLRGKRVAGIGPNPPESPPACFWSTYFSASDVDAHAKAITEAGGTVSFGPMEVMDQGRMLVGQDPLGAMFGVWEPRAHIGAQIVNEHATVSWNELIGDDLERTTGFYGAVFGVAFEDLPGAPYKLMKVGDDVVGGISGMGADLPPHWLTYFMHDDVDAGFARAAELGGEIVGEVVDSQFGRYARVRDPQGAVFGLISSRNEEGPGNAGPEGQVP
jgi:predicted enzyme related to lactoylglutathione lyase